MKHLKFIAVILLFTITLGSYAGNKTVAVTGTIYEKINDLFLPLSLANVHCLGTIEGTTSSSLGNFTMNLKEGKYKMVFSYAGYGQITKEIVIKKRKNKKMYLEVVLEKEIDMRYAEIKPE